MNSRPRSMGIEVRGLTLVEMLVTATLFLAISAATGAMLFQTQRASEKSVATNDANSKALLLFEKLRLELRNGRVVDNPLPEKLHYWIYQKKDGVPKFKAPGKLEFLSESGTDPDIAEVSGEGENLVRTFQGKKRILASLGKDGEVRFRWLVGLQALVVEGKVGETHSKNSISSEKEFHFILALSNVE